MRNEANGKMGNSPNEANATESSAPNEAEGRLAGGGLRAGLPYWYAGSWLIRAARLADGCPLS